MKLFTGPIRKIWDAIGTIGFAVFVLLMLFAQFVRIYPGILSEIPEQYIARIALVAIVAVAVSFIIFGIDIIILSIENWLSREILFRKNGPMPIKKQDIIAHKITIIVGKVLYPAMGGLFLCGIGAYFGFGLITNWQSILSMFGPW